MSTDRPLLLSEISVVVQGPILGDPWRQKDLRYTYQVLRQLRRLMPGATLILSTWDNQNVTDLDYDILVQSPDPGGLPLRIENGKQVVANNVNRQIVSTLMGLRAAKTKFAMKIRSDLILHDLKFLEYYNAFPARDKQFSFTKERVLNSAFHSRVGANRTACQPCCFHPSDWFFFGRTEDLLDIWDLPLMTSQDGMWFENRPKPQSIIRDETGHISRMMPEPYIWSRFVQKKMSLNYDSYLQTSPELCRLSEQTIANNLVLLDLNQLSIQSLKYPYLDWRLGWRNFSGRFTFRIWCKMYREFCDQNAKVPIFDRAVVAYIWRFITQALIYSVHKSRHLLVRALRAWLDVDEY